MAANSIEQLIAGWEARLRQAFLDALASIRDRIVIALVAERLEKGDVEGALRAVGLDPVAFRGLEGEIEQAFAAGGRDVVDRLPAIRQPDGHRLAIRFDARNPRAENWLRAHSATLVREILEDQRTAIRQHLMAGMEAGQNPTQTARELVGRIHPRTGKREGGVIGLTASQEAWSRTYAAELAAGDAKALGRALRDKRFDRTVEKAIREGRPIPAEMQAKMVAAYRARALRYRSEVIARTEAMTALHAAQDEALRQGVESGQIQERQVRRIWRSAKDVRVRETHSVLSGQSVGLNEVFISPSGARLRYPGDPLAPAAERCQCRCWVETRIDHLANVA